MNWLDKVVPLNLADEKEKFFRDFSYNPQFTYEEAFAEDELTKFGKPREDYAQLAQEILDKAYFGRNETDLIMNEGKEISHDEVTQKFQTFLEMHSLEKRYEILWSSTFISRATITEDKIKLRSTAKFHREGLIGLLYHEIGTHALRRVNYEKQPWYKKKNDFGITHSYLRTEEGLATIHGLLPRSLQLAYATAIRYVAIIQAQKKSFAELWQFLMRYIDDPETRWMVTLRQKRGLTDTSVPGGPTKDLVYFEGLIQVGKWLVQNEYDLSSLYFGKIAIEDLEIAKKLFPSFQPLLPSFYVLKPELYQKGVQKIVKENFLDQINL